MPEHFLFKSVNNHYNKRTMTTNKFVIFAPSLSGGGAERVISTLSIQAPSSIEISIILLRGEISYLVKHTIFLVEYPTNRRGLIKSLIKFAKLLRSQKPKTVLFFGKLGMLDYFIAVSSSISYTILRVQNYNFEKFVRGALRRFVTRLRERLVLQFFVDEFIAVSKPIKSKLSREYGIPENRINVIYNPCDISLINKLACEKIEESLLELFAHQVIINVGGLVRAKGQWHLIRAFKRVSQEVPDARLVILGEGVLKNYLEKLISDLNLNDKVFLLGWRSNPFKYMARSTLFCFPSLWEGFGNAIVEALACGLPVMSADCLSGPREILAPGTRYKVYRLKKPEYAEYGILMPVMDGKLYSASDPLTWQEEVWAEEIIRCLTNPEKLSEYRSKAISRVRDFDAKKIAKRYFEVLLKE